MINEVLNHFLLLDDERKSRQNENLRRIITKGAELNLLLFGQASAWSADWELTVGSQRHNGYNLAVFPRLYMPDRRKHLGSDNLPDFLKL
jgi:hypothetical protein